MKHTRTKIYRERGFSFRGLFLQCMYVINITYHNIIIIIYEVLFFLYQGLSRLKIRTESRILS